MSISNSDLLAVIETNKYSEYLSLVGAWTFCADLDYFHDKELALDIKKHFNLA